MEDISEGLFIEEYLESEKKLFKQKLANESLLLSYHSLIKNPDGRRVLWDILEMCGVFTISFTGNSKTYFNEGKRSIGLYLVAMLNIGNSFEDVLEFQKLMPEDDA